MFLIDLIKPDLKMHKSTQSARSFMATVSAELSEEILKRGNSLRIRVTGTSMNPFIRDEEYVTIGRVRSSRLRAGDIIFYLGRDNQYILHRIIKRQKKGGGAFIFQTKGDAMMAYDSPVSKERILGRVDMIEKIEAGHTSKIIDLQSGKWRIINYLLALIHRIRSALYFRIYSHLRK